MDHVICGGKKRRGRKRKISEVQNVTVDDDGKRKAVQTRSLKLVGCYVRKKFQDGGMYLGKITFYGSGLYRVHYEDGDFEDLDSGEVKSCLVADVDLNGDWLERKEKLDAFLLGKDTISVVSKVENGLDYENVGQADAQERQKITNGGSGPNTELGAEDDGSVHHDAGSSSDSCEDTLERDGRSDLEETQVPAPEIPPSSGHIGVPEEYASHLFSVYSFLRSFSVPIFLYPIGLDDFVGSLNCSVANTLLDSVHVALLRALKRHMERLSLSGSELSLKCMRCMDWSLLDNLTWPVFVVHYLGIMGYMDKPYWKGFCVHALERDYYSLSVGRKLVILQILSDEVIDSEEVRAEMNMREESEVGLVVDSSMTLNYNGGARRVNCRLPRTTNQNFMEQQATVSAVGCHPNPAGTVDEDGNGDECCICGMDGLLLCCDGCPLSYHTRCLGVSKMHMSEGLWYCPRCTVNKAELEILKGTTLRGGHNFGVDRHGQVFVATCDHLLVLKASGDSGVCVRYYSRQDIPRVLRSLYSNADYACIYLEICRGIVRYWELPGDILPYSMLSENNNVLECDKGGGAYTSRSDNLLGKSMPDTPVVEEDGVYYNNAITAANTANYSATNYIQNPVISGNSLSSLTGLDEVANADSKGNPVGVSIYMGTSFKETGYVNSFLHGDFVASAAANLAMLSCEENHVSESRTSNNHRKFLSDNVALQVKAFSLAATRFFWPLSERKLAEVPRERCSWCLYCKATVVSKRGCLLNAAASNAIKGSMKVLSVARTLKTGVGRLADISIYMMFMEESLSGLVAGPFLYESFRERWRKQVEQAVTYGEIKSLLLELEENIRAVAFSGDWLRHVESSIQTSTCQIVANASTSVQKHRPGRRGRKPSNLIEESSNDHQEMTDFTWWRGGKLSKLLFLREVLPYSTTRKAALQSGFKKIPGIHYVDGDDAPKASRQLMWRSSVEKSRNIADLALQVRYLDSNLKWSDLIRPEQTTIDVKGSEAEASSFRNAFICDKKIVGHETRYCVAFGCQKHLPSRLMKNIAETEKAKNDGKERYWFCESRIPLYLIKEYEEKLGRNKDGTAFSRLKNRSQKAYRRRIFFSLWGKQDTASQIICCSCGQDIFYWNAFKCSKCQGFFHSKCATDSTLQLDQELPAACKECFEATRCQSNNGSPKSPLLLQTQDLKQTSTSNRSRNSLGKKGLVPAEGNVDCSSEMKAKKASSIVKKSNKFKYWGLILKKSSSEDTGFDFRLRNILLKGNPHMNLTNPVCRLCYKEYNPDLIYVRCETCHNWYHTDALELDESKIFDVVGFKCPKCRRIRSPTCPYIDSDKKKASEHKFEIKAPELDETLSMNADEFAPPIISPHFQQFSDSSEFDNGWNNSDLSGSGPKKLPVRRHIKQENGMFSTHSLDPFQLDLPIFDGNALNTNKKLPVERRAGADDLLDFREANNGCLPESIHSQVNGIDMEYENIGYDDTDFEPQTYFSFQELLASDDYDQEWKYGTENMDTLLEISYDQEEPLISLEVFPCKICSHTEPYPDLSCRTCGIWIHSHCSPWVESSIDEFGWQCGSCRKWR